MKVHKIIEQSKGHGSVLVYAYTEYARSWGRNSNCYVIREADFVNIIKD